MRSRSASDASRWRSIYSVSSQSETAPTFSRPMMPRGPTGSSLRGDSSVSGAIRSSIVTKISSTIFPPGICNTAASGSSGKKSDQGRCPCTTPGSCRMTSGLLMLQVMSDATSSMPATQVNNRDSTGTLKRWVSSGRLAASECAPGPSAR